MSLNRRTLLAAILLAAPAGLARAAGAVARKAPVVTIKDMAFGPAPKGLKVGDILEWVNADIFQHTATARDHSFDLDLKPGAKGQAVLKAAGTVDVYCRYHPGMKLRLTVAK